MATSLSQIHADLALEGLSTALGKFSANAMESLVHGSEGDFKDVKRLLEELVDTVAKAEVERKSTSTVDARYASIDA